MTIQDYRLSINELLDEINDQAVLEAYYEILRNVVKVADAQVIGYEPNGSPINKTQLVKEVTEAQKRVASGEFISHENLKQQMKDW